MKILTADGSYIKSQILDVERCQLEQKNREAEVCFLCVTVDVLNKHVYIVILANNYLEFVISK